MGRCFWPESSDYLSSLRPVQGGKLLVEYLHNVSSVLQLRDLSTGALLRELPSGLGSIDDLTASSDHSEAFWVYNSFTEPNTVYRSCHTSLFRRLMGNDHGGAEDCAKCKDTGREGQRHEGRRYAVDVFNGDTPTSHALSHMCGCRFNAATPDVDPVVWQQAAPVGWDPSQFVTVQEWTSSRDGTRFPLFITRPKDAPMDGSNPTILYAYGGKTPPPPPGAPPPWALGFTQASGTPDFWGHGNRLNNRSNLDAPQDLPLFGSLVADFSAYGGLHSNDTAFWILPNKDAPTNRLALHPRCVCRLGVSRDSTSGVGRMSVTVLQKNSVSAHLHQNVFSAISPRTPSDPMHELMVDRPPFDGPWTTTIVSPYPQYANIPRVMNPGARSFSVDAKCSKDCESPRLQLNFGTLEEERAAGSFYGAELMMEASSHGKMFWLGVRYLQHALGCQFNGTLPLHTPSSHMCGCRFNAATPDVDPVVGSRQRLWVGPLTVCDGTEWTSSRDGTRFPLDSSPAQGCPYGWFNPTILYAYGGKTPLPPGAPPPWALGLQPRQVSRPSVNRTQREKLQVTLSAATPTRANLF
eukprot:jgi/Botrbrau1/7351/Bobra.247_3s0043.1